MSTFSQYTFKETFPNVAILNWCILGALDWMCSIIRSAHTGKALFRQPPEKKKKKMGGQVAYLAKWEHDKAFKNYICALAEEKDCFLQSMS